MFAASSAPALPRLPALDGVRVIGAAAVIAQHVGFITGVTTRESWGGWVAMMDFAVALFFVLSGFLLFRPWARAAATGSTTPGARRFYWKRAIRILPAYWLAVIVCLTVLPEGGVAPLGDWLRHLTFTQIYEHAQIRRGLGQTWSLATEVLFYLLLPFAAAALLGKRWRPARTVTLAGAGLVITVGWIAAMGTGLLDTGLHIMWLPSYALWFAAGIVIAAVHVALRTSTAPRSWQVIDQLGSAPLACWGIALGLLAVASTPVTGPRGLAAPTAGQFATQMGLYLGVAVMVMIPLVFGPTTLISLALGSAPIRWLGTLSYGMFLWHPLVLDLIYRVEDRTYFTGNPLRIYALTLGGAIAMAAVSYYVVERPVLRWGSATARRRAGRATEHQRAVSAASAAS
ncbi:acyltransferase family protein [Micromonospora cremea]|uniref:Peptidoglycan/LPS O-acetylase OafA/YrhL, contains acyltransferase and SGNH-hydrolase domains n=1 Tax=Micromonospora cremea TaxID=709881 RepID=A0A1N5ZVH4_9ACTN|nr:acyltransferase [Micromonospora cremea]SIN25794.1 Peptidoglycan/LPS O-acetylase OafA/YrhL, contains acyltransferase and SGNH-hydrolase domains [Micromonospora cremea]